MFIATTSLNAQLSSVGGPGTQRTVLLSASDICLPPLHSTTTAEAARVADTVREAGAGAPDVRSIIADSGFLAELIQSQVAFGERVRVGFLHTNRHYRPAGLAGTGVPDLHRLGSGGRVCAGGHAGAGPRVPSPRRGRFVSFFGRRRQSAGARGSDLYRRRAWASENADRNRIIGFQATDVARVFESIEQRVLQIIYLFFAVRHADDRVCFRLRFAI